MDGLRVVGDSGARAAPQGKRDIGRVGLPAETKEGTDGISEDPDDADRQQRVRARVQTIGEGQEDIPVLPESHGRMAGLDDVQLLRDVLDE